MPKAKKTSSDRRILLLVAALILIIVGLLIIKSYKMQRHFSQTGVVPTPAPSIIADVTYKCDDNKSIQAIYQPNRVMLQLSDGRSIVVEQAISADGARYANSDESFVFWNKGDTAFIQEGQSTTFADCNGDKTALTPTKGDVVVKGELVCLPHKNTSGPQTMECAYGLKSNNEYYGLSDTDPGYKNISSAPMNKMVEVTGALKLTVDSKYDTIGTLYVTSIKQL